MKSNNHNNSVSLVIDSGGSLGPRRSHLRAHELGAYQPLICKSPYPVRESKSNGWWPFFPQVWQLAWRLGRKMGISVCWWSSWPVEQGEPFGSTLLHTDLFWRIKETHSFESFALQSSVWNSSKESTDDNTISSRSTTLSFIMELLSFHYKSDT
jgi:hypothetical protein